MEKRLNRLYKARLFVMIFEDKKKLLELYNAVSGKHYEDPELLEINTLENAIYMSMRNDLSFLIDARLSLYEHQSTYSPNLALRFLFYLSDILSGMTADANLYGTKKVQIPAPRFVVFYNGEEEQPDRQILKLSELYAVKEEVPKLEMEILMLNVNQGHNPELMEACHTLWEYAEYTGRMEACHTLWEYAEYTGRVRRYAKDQPIAEAVERAITECIREGVLKEFLEKNRREAKNVSIYEYDQEKHIRQEREEAWEAGERKGEENKLKNQIQKKLAKGKSVSEIAEALEEEEDTIQRLVKELS